MSRPTDLLVVGGGPAGATLAALAARAGARVVLLERGRFPRDKVCGEFVSSEGVEVLRRIGALDALVAAGAPWIDRVRLTEPRGHAVSSRLPEMGAGDRRGLGVSRAHMDRTLIELAAGHGADVRYEQRVGGPWVESGRVVGVNVRNVRGPGGPASVRARLVVAADGRRSSLARALHPERCDPRRTRPDSWFGIKTHLEGGPETLEGQVELHLFDGGYAGLAAVEADRINLCLLTRVSALRACGGSPDRLLAERVLANPAARGRIGGAAIVSRWHSVGPLRFGVRRPYAAGALFVGDAAGTIDPFCGEGMSNALCGAELALPHVLAALDAGGLAERAGRRYARTWTDAFAPVTRRVRGIGFLLSRPRLAGTLIRWLDRHGRRLTPRLVAATRTGS